MAGDQKKALRKGQTIIWVDEVAFYLLSGVVRTYAPRGQTPRLAVPLTREHLAVIGALTRSGRLLAQVQEHAFHGAEVVGFLRHLLTQVPGRLLVLWDGGSIHWDHNIQAFLTAGGAARVELEPLPGYAPEVNPVEGIWRYLKRVELGNVCCRNQGELRHQVRLAVARIRQKPDVIQACFQHAGY